MADNKKKYLDEDGLKKFSELNKSYIESLLGNIKLTGELNEDGVLNITMSKDE